MPYSSRPQEPFLIGGINFWSVLPLFLSVPENLDTGNPTVRWLFAIRSVVREQVCGNSLGFDVADFLPVDPIDLDPAPLLRVCTRRVHNRPRAWLGNAILSIYSLVFLVWAFTIRVDLVLRD